MAKCQLSMYVCMAKCQLSKTYLQNIHDVCIVYIDLCNARLCKCMHKMYMSVRMLWRINCKKTFRQLLAKKWTQFKGGHK